MPELVTCIIRAILPYIYTDVNILDGCLKYKKTENRITKPYLYNFDTLKPHFHVVKLGFTGYTLVFLFLLKNIDCGYVLEPHRRCGSNEYPQSMF